VGDYPPQPVSVLRPTPTLSLSFLLAQAIFELNLSAYKYSNILKPTHPSYLSAYEDGTASVPKHRHIKFRRRGITKKKAYNKFIPQFTFSEQPLYKNNKINGGSVLASFSGKKVPQIYLHYSRCS